MTDVVTVAHPGLVRHVPQGCRQWRHSLVRVDTPVNLRTLSWSETQEGPTLTVEGRSLLRTRIVDGRLYRVPGADMYGTARAGRGHLTGKGLRSWLAGDGLPPSKPDRSETMRCFAGTPLVGSLDKDRWSLASRPLSQPERIGTVHVDLRDEARAALRRYFENDVLVAGGVALVRYKGPNAQFQQPLDMHPVDGRKTYLGLPRFPGLSTYQNLCHGFHYRTNQAVLIRKGRTQGQVVQTWDDDLDGLEQKGADDVWLSLHALMQGIFEDLTRHTYIVWDDEAVRQRGLTIAERAATHALRDEDLWEACHAIEALCRTGYHWRGQPRTRGLDGLTHADRYLDYVETYARPRLRVEGLSFEDDINDVSSLPGPR